MQDCLKRKEWLRSFILILLLVGIGGYVIRSYFKKDVGSLSIYSTPAGAKVYLNGEEIGETPINVPELVADEYTLRLTLEGFEDYGGIIRVQANKPTTIRVTLVDIQPIRIISTPIKSTKPGRPVLIKASIIDNLGVKEVKLFYRRTGGRDYETTDMSLIGNTYQACIPASYLTPGGVEYYIQASDGTNLSYFPPDPSTPQRIEVAKEMVVAARPSEEIPPVRPVIKLGPIKAPADKTTLMGDFLTGEIQITSLPPQADVYLNGIYKGKTPLTLKGIQAWKAYGLRVVMKGYKEWTSKVFTDPGKTTHLKVVLEPIIGAYLYITSIPYGANIYLDGEIIGQTPLRGVEVTEGSHWIKVSMAGFKDKEKEIVAVAGQATFANFILEKEGE